MKYANNIDSYNLRAVCLLRAKRQKMTGCSSVAEHPVWSREAGISKFPTQTRQKLGGRVRILIEILTNKRTRIYAFDFYCRWPFFAFENLTHKDIGEE